MTNKVKSNQTVKTPSVDDVVFNAIVRKMGSRKSPWETTMTEVLAYVRRNAKNVTLPASPAALRRVLNRVANRLRRKGSIQMNFFRTSDHARKRIVRFFS